MAASLDALSQEQRALLVGMLDVPPCPVDERDLTAAARRHAASGLGAPGPELVDRLTDHFLRVSPERLVSWVHPSWRDLVIDRLAGDGPARRAFLAAASLEGLLLAVSTGGAWKASGRFHC